MTLLTIVCLWYNHYCMNNSLSLYIYIYIYMYMLYVCVYIYIYMYKYIYYVHWPAPEGEAAYSKAWPGEAAAFWWPAQSLEPNARVRRPSIICKPYMESARLAETRLAQNSLNCINIAYITLTQLKYQCNQMHVNSVYVVCVYIYIYICICVDMAITRTKYQRNMQQRDRLTSI